jgi:drug/metabolite transporter (DMT)-like permease
LIAHSLVSAVCAGGADFLGGYASTPGTGIRVARSAQLAGLPLACILAGALGFDALTGSDVLWSASAGLAIALGLACFYPAMALGSIGVGATVAATTGAVVPLAFGIAQGEQVGPVTTVGLLAALSAVVAVSMSPADGRTPTPASSVALAGVSGVGFGLFNVCLAHVSTKAGAAPIAVERATAAAVLVALSLFVRPAQDDPLRRWGFAAAIGALEVGGTVALLAALRDGPLGVASVLASLYPVITVILALVIAGERLSRRQQAGVASAVAAVTLIALG